MLRGYPSRMKPLWQSASEIRSRMIEIIKSSGISPPCPRMASTRRPSGVSSRATLRSISPLDIWGMPNLSVSQAAWVPFPAPGYPIRTTFKLRTPPPDSAPLQEPFVAAHDEVAFDLPLGVDRHPDHDEQAVPPKKKGTVEPANQVGRQDDDGAEVDRPDEGKAAEGPVDEVRRRPPRAPAGMKPPYLRRLSATSNGLNIMAV